MNFGEAYIQLTPQLIAGAARKVLVDATKVGNDAGQAMGKTFTDRAKVEFQKLLPAKINADIKPALVALDKFALKAKEVAKPYIAKFEANIAPALASASALRVKLNDVAKTYTTKFEANTKPAEANIKSLRKQTQLLTNAIVAIGPATVPVLATVAGGALGISSAIGSSVVALGVFGAATKTAFKDVKDASDKTEDLRKKIDLLTERIRVARETGIGNIATLEKARISAVNELIARYNLMPPALRQVTMSYDNMKSSWQRFVDQNKPAIFGIMRTGFDAVTNAVGKLQPLFDIGAQAAQRLAKQFSDWTAGTKFENFIKFLSTSAAQSMNTLGNIARNVGITLANMFKGFEPSGQSFLKWLETATARMRQWSSGNGLEKFIKYVTDSGPQVGSLLANIAAAILQIAKAVTPLAPITLAVASAFAALIAAMPPRLITVLVAAFVLYNTTLALVKASVVATSVVQGLFAGVMGRTTVATASNTVAVNANKIGLLANAAATKVVTAAQWLWNAALSANPIGIVVVAIAALIAIIVLAYKNNETFRKIVDAVWAAIKVAIGATVDWFKNTAWPAIKTALDALGMAFNWLWKNVIVPVWEGIKTTINAVWSGFIKPTFDALAAALKIVGNVFMFFWNNVIKPVWAGIQLAISIAWKAIEINFKSIQVAVKALEMAFMWFWNNVIVPVWNGIKLAIQTAWNFIRDNIFTPIITFLKTVFKAAWDAFKVAIDVVWGAIKLSIQTAWNFIRDNIFIPIMNFLKNTLLPKWEAFKIGLGIVWDWIKNKLKTGWDWMRDNVFKPIIQIITKDVPNGFDKAVGFIQKAWDKVQEIVKKPVKFVVETVINNGIIRGFNVIAKAVGVSPIDPVKLSFASGGVLPGYTPGRDVHTFTGQAGTLNLSGGEAIMRPEFTRAFGHDQINRWNRAARTGGMRGVEKASASMGFAKGGVIGGLKGAGGWVWDKTKDAAAAVTSTMETAWNAFRNPAGTLKAIAYKMLGNVPNADTRWSQFLRGGINKLLDGVTPFIDKWFARQAPGDGGYALEGGSGGPGNYNKMFAWVKSRFPGAQLYSGLRNSTTLSGNTSLHASGRAIDITPDPNISRAIINTFGAKITELISPWPDQHIWHGKHHNYNDAIDAQHGVPGSDGVSRNAHIHWAMKNGGLFKYDNGGWLYPDQVGINTTRKPEAVLTADESAGLKGLSVGELADLLRELIEEVKAIAPGVGGAINGVGSQLLVRGRIR